MSDEQNTSAELSPEQTAQLVSEAMQPEMAPDKVSLCGREIPIRFMPIKKEREVIKLLAPFLPKLSGLAGGTELTVMADIAVEAADVLPKAIAIVAGDVADEAWIEENCSAVDLIPVAMAQLAKYRQQDLLGKLFKGSVR